MSRWDLEILPQPNDETCGATCLHAIYRFYGEDNDIFKLIGEIPAWETGGTIAVNLGCHALEKGYSATIYTYNLHVFDPTWFDVTTDLSEKIRKQMEYKKDPKLHWASHSYLKFLRLGGRLKFEELNRNLIKRHLEAGTPLLTGLNATYLYRSAREFNSDYDDIRGTSMGHFVVLNGYNVEEDKMWVTDPLLPNPFSPTHVYYVDVDRVINSIMLGILTYDANILIIEKKHNSNGTNNTGR